MARYRFQFRPVLTFASVIAIALLIALGNWQLQRLEWKRDLIAQVEALGEAEPIPFVEAVRRARNGEVMDYAPVTLSGNLRADLEARVFGTFVGKAGVYVFAPLETVDGVIYLNRGFAPQAAAGEACFCSETDGAVSVTGLFRSAENPSPPASWFQSAGKSVDGLWTRRNPVAFADEAGLETSPFYVDESAVPGRDWPRGGTTRLEFTNRHLEYAWTWFGLAATLVGVWFAFSLQKRD